MSHICATLLLLCYQPNIIDFEHQFVEEVKQCAIEYNAMIEPHDRIPIVLVIAQAIQETGYGTSRFYKEANNLFGIIALEGEDYIVSLKDEDRKLRRYDTKCDSVNHYMNMLVTDINYTELQEILIYQYITDEIDVDALISSLCNYAEDQFYGRKLRKIVKKLQNNL